MKEKKKSWMQSVFAYAEKEKKKMVNSVVLSVLSVSAGLFPFYCMYRVICLFTADAVTTGGIVTWCLGALAAYLVKILAFRLRYARGRDRQ